MPIKVLAGEGTGSPSCADRRIGVGDGPDQRAADLSGACGRIAPLPCGSRRCISSMTLSPRWRSSNISVLAMELLLIPHACEIPRASRAPRRVDFFHPSLTPLALASAAMRLTRPWSQRVVQVLDCVLELGGIVPGFL